jgi:hypothetical protein
MIIVCPSCKQMIEIVEINCQIFRCGMYKANYQQIDPHLPKIQCDQLVANSLIFGCAKPFRLVPKDSSKPLTLDAKYDVVVCDYI